MTRCPRCQRRFPPNGTCPVHGKPTAVVDAAEPEPALPVAAPPGWRLGHRIGSGGTAVVYAVERDGQPPAVMKWGRWPERDIQARLAREASVLRALGPPTTAAYVDHGELRGWPYLVMEHVPGELLAAWMARAGARGSFGEIIAILTRLAAALGAIHDAGFVHCDLKPENVVIGARGVRVLDFGLARPRDAPTDAAAPAGYVVGTVHYLAPEQIRTGGVVDHRADIYSFGAIAFEMLAGAPPFVGDRRAIEYRHQVVRPPSVRETRDVPEELDALVTACLAKQAESRPQSAGELRDALARALASLSTLLGVGAAGAAPKPLGKQGQVVLAWIVGGDPLAVARALADVHGIVVRQRGDGILAAFTPEHHDAPLVVARDACRRLLRERCRIVVHVSSALVRRSAEGRVTVYGPDIERVEVWTPGAPFAGLVLTAAAAAHAPGATTPAGDVAGYFRELERDVTDVTDARATPTLVGRTPLVTNLTAAAAGARTMLIGVSGGAGAGKTRVLDAVSERLRAAGREVAALRARRRFDGDRPDDDRLLELLGGGDAATALARAGARGVAVVIDDVHRLSRELCATLLRDDLRVVRVLASPEPLFEMDGRAADRLAIQLPPLSHADAELLLREQLRPAHLIPDVLIERLAIRGAGNPALLVALVRDIKRRGAIRRHAAGDQWYVAADELDTLLAPPGPSWLADRALEELPAELVPVATACAGLGPRFSATEVAAVLGLPDAAARLDWLASEGLLAAHDGGGGYEFADAALQDAIYAHALDDRATIHARAFAYWSAYRAANLVAWLARLAYHGARAGEPTTAAACLLALARDLERRGEHDAARDLRARALATLEDRLAPAVAEATRLVGAKRR